MSLETDWEGAVPVGVEGKPNLEAAWETAKPVTFKGAAPASAPKSEESPYSAKNLAGAAVEPPAALASGALAAPVSGLAGILGTLLPGREGQGADWTRRVGEAMTYQPRSQGGQTATGAISYPFEKIAEGADRAGGAVSDATGSPAAGAGVNTLLQMLPQLAGAKGMKAGAAGFDRAKANIGPELGMNPLPKPPVGADVQALLDKGVKVTPGEIKGGAWARAEEGLQSIPGVGDLVKNARGRGVDSLNRAAWNDALEAAGEKPMPSSVKTGHEAAAHVRNALGDRYESLLPNMSGMLDRPAAPANALPAPGGLGKPPQGPSFRQELDSLVDLARQQGGLPPAEMRQLRRIVEKEVKGKFDEYGRAPGATLKEIQETLRTERQDYAVGNPAERKLSRAIQEVEASMRRMIADTNPAYAAELQKIDAGYAKFKIAQEAAGGIGAKEGVFKPAGYDRSVRSHDRTKDHRAFSEGTANQQDLSGAGKRVLSDTLPDSGSPFRLSLMHMLSDPKAMGATALAGIPTWLLYSPVGVQIMQSLLTNPGAAGRAGAMAAPFGAAQTARMPPPPPQ